MLCGPGRSPCGERGLKYSKPEEPAAEGVSLPVRGAWIEILRMAGDVEYVKSLPVRGAWIEMALVRIADFYGVSSLPVRGAWIEIPKGGCPLCRPLVAPRAGSVD